MSKETAFYPRLRELTDDWMDLFGYWAPLNVTDTLEEYRAVRERAGLMDFTMLRKVDIDGAGALELVNRVVTRDVSKLEPGQIAYGALCDENGKMVDDCTVMRRDAAGEHVRFCGANDRDHEIFTQLAAGTQIRVREFTDDMPHLCLQGPLSRQMLQPLANQDLSNDVFPYYRFREDVEIAGIPIFMTRLGYTAELGYELWVDRDRALDLWDALVEATEPQGMKLVGMTALDLFRIEGGFIIGGVEYDSTVSPYEAGLGWSVAFEKGEFQGRSGLERDRDATTLRLTSVVLESGGDDASGAPLAVEGTEVGLVTQAIVSPHLGGKTLGLAKVRKDLAKKGTKLTANVGGNEVGGEVVDHPVYDPERKRAKQS
ncbi:MAG TPA: aminomethyltransferase family protein [Gaiellaceae bacterium]|nr:aminomethyltransferase family protein [Gaiellaceae bacterium]